MPKIAEIEGTPNPCAMKFILKEPLTWGVSRSYDNAQQAQGDALAAALFAIPHVTNVFYVDRWITITQDGRVDWQELMRKVAEPIRAAPAAAERSAQIAEATRSEAPQVNERDRERLERINALLDEHVRPYLQGDGGDLYVTGLEGNILSVHYQGACGSCPSSLSATLTGIEGLVQQVAPDLQVVPV